MNLYKVLLTGALLWGAPVFSQQDYSEPKVSGGKFQWFLLTENPEQVRRLVGPPRMTAPFGADFLSWQYQIGEGDHDDFSHQFVFSKSQGVLVGVTRNFDPERVVDEFFPPAETSICYYPDRKSPQYSVRIRRLSGGRILMSPGAANSGQPAGQVVLMRESALAATYPWAADQLAVLSDPKAR